MIQENDAVNDAENCKNKVIHKDAVEKTRKMMFTGDETYQISELFKMFGDPLRVNILKALAGSEMCVCDIAYLLGMNQSAVSHQLRVLKQARLVKYRKEGKNVFYMLDDDHVTGILDQGLAHIGESR
jgi:ArsR family transcriptional regulator